MTIVDAARPVTGGVDTHLGVNVAAALDPVGGLLAVAEFPTTSAGHRELLGWLSGFGPVARVGVEGTGSYGAGLARFLRAAGVEVVEVDRPNRQARRRAGKPRPAGRDRGGPGSDVWPGLWGGQVPGWERGGDPGAGGGQTLRPVCQDPGPQPDPPPQLHRARAAPPAAGRG
ncbi:MAG: IS110 family transposase, partial [Micromonosporaceae bacterium]